MSIWLRPYVEYVKSCKVPKQLCKMGVLIFYVLHMTSKLL